MLKSFKSWLITGCSDKIKLFHIILLGDWWVAVDNEKTQFFPQKPQKHTSKKPKKKWETTGNYKAITEIKVFCTKEGRNDSFWHKWLNALFWPFQKRLELASATHIDCKRKTMCMWYVNAIFWSHLIDSICNQ